MMKLLRTTFLLLVLLSFVLSSQAQTSDLQIQLTSATSLYPGQVFSYTYTISNNGPNSVSNATFNNNLPPGVQNVTWNGCTASGGASCPTNYPFSNTNFNGTIPLLPSGGQIEMSITLEAPSPPYSTSFSNTATVDVPAGVTDPILGTNTSTWNITLLTNLDIETIVTTTSKAVSCGFAPDTAIHTVSFVNHGPARADSVLLNFRNLIGGFRKAGGGFMSVEMNLRMEDSVWTASPGSELYPTNQFVSSTRYFQSTSNTNQNFGTGYYTFSNRRVKRWEVGDTITLTWKNIIDDITTTGCGYSLNAPNMTGANGYFTIPNNTSLTDTVSNNNSKVAYSRSLDTCFADACPVIDIETIVTTTSKAVSCGFAPDTAVHTVSFVNHGPARADSVLLNFRNLIGGFRKAGGGSMSIEMNLRMIDSIWTASPGSELYPTNQFISNTRYFQSTTNTNQNYGTGYYTFSNRRVKRWEVGEKTHPGPV